MVVDSFNTELGYELIGALRHAYYLHSQKLLTKTISGKQSEAFYYFSPKHEINKSNRSFDNTIKAHQAGYPNSAIHRLYLDEEKCITPDYKNHFANTEYLYEKPIICICNRYNIEWSYKPINFFDLDTLRSLFKLLKNKYQIIYFSCETHEDFFDGVKPLFIDDIGMTHREFPEVKLFHELVGKDKDWNTEMLKVFANCENYITMNGAYSILASFFGGKNLIYSRKDTKYHCKEIECGSFQRWYPNFNDGITKYVSTHETLINTSKTFFVDNLPIINVLVRTHGRRTHFNNCMQSIYQQDYPNVNIIVGVENNDEKTARYVAEHQVRTIKYLPVDKNTGFSKQAFFPFNRYLDYLNNHVKSGYICYLDDDDKFLTTDALSKIAENKLNENTVYFWRTKISERLIPNDTNWGKEPVSGDISGITFLFHHSKKHLAFWDIWKRGDYKVASNLYKNLKSVFINEVLTCPQDGYNHNGINHIALQPELTQKPKYNMKLKVLVSHYKGHFIGAVNSEIKEDSSTGQELIRKGLCVEIHDKPITESIPKKEDEIKTEKWEVKDNQTEKSEITDIDTNKNEQKIEKSTEEIEAERIAKEEADKEAERKRIEDEENLKKNKVPRTKKKMKINVKKLVEDNLKNE